MNATAHAPAEGPAGVGSGIGWMRNAACTRPGTRGLPWTTDVQLLPPVVVELMAETCALCPVQAACARYALTEEIDGGFWAGHDRSRSLPSAAPVRLAQTEQLLLPLDLPAVPLGGAA